MLHQKLFGLLIFLLPMQLGRHFWPDWAYVLGLRVDYLSPTIYLTDLLVAAILVLWLKKDIKYQISKVKNQTQNLKLLILPIGFFCFLLANSLLATNPGAALYKFFKVIEFALFSFYVAKNQYSIFSLQCSVIGAVIYSSLLAIAQFVKQASLGGIFWWLGERTFSIATPGIAKAVISGRLMLRSYATFPHPNALAGFILVGLILTLPAVRSKRLAIGYWLLTVSALVLTFSRSVWLTGLLVLVFYLSKKRRWFFVLGSLLVGSGIFFFSQQFSGPEAAQQRLQLTKAAVAMIRSHPLAGVGLNNFLVHLPTVSPARFLQPVHNIYLLVAAETGILGLAVFLWFFYLTFKKLLTTPPKRRAGNHYSLITGLSAILALALFDHYWFTLQQTQLLFAIILGLTWVKPKRRVKITS